jgi:hypothetical protein
MPQWEVPCLLYQCSLGLVQWGRSSFVSILVTTLQAKYRNRLSRGRNLAPERWCLQVLRKLVPEPFKCFSWIFSIGTFGSQRVRRWESFHIQFLLSLAICRGEWEGGDPLPTMCVSASLGYKLPQPFFLRSLPPTASISELREVAILEL